MADYYDILGVSRTADERDIRQAYRRLARQHHPDVNPGDDASAERFKSINAAYEVLSDADKRAKYDRYGDQWQHAGHFEQQGGRDYSRFFRGKAPGGGGSGFSFNTGGATLSDILGGLGRFGDLGGVGERMRPRPADIPVDITLEEADVGTTRRVNLPGGRRLEVRIPAGIADGGRVHIAAGGDSAGEFNLVVTVLPHQRFERKGSDLDTSLDVPLLDAVLGGTAQVQTLRGQIELTLPRETQNGRRFRLVGQGMARLNDPERRGNLYATINVTLPSNLTDEQRNLFEQMRAVEVGNEADGEE